MEPDGHAAGGIVEENTVLHRVEALVIKSIDYGESGKIVTLFTEGAGKVGVLARGAKKTGSRYAAAAEPFTHGEYVFFRAAGLGTLNSADIIESHRRIREDLLLSAVAAYLAEMTDRVTVDGEAAPRLYRQLLAALAALEDGKDAQVITHIYEMNILAHAGYMPVLDGCAGCGGAADDAAGFSIALGGLVCRGCAGKDGETLKPGEPVIRLLRLFASVDLSRVGRIDLKAETKETLRRVMRRWMDRHLDIRFRSRHVLEQLEQAGF